MKIFLKIRPANLLDDVVKRSLSFTIFNLKYLNEMMQNDELYFKK